MTGRADRPSRQPKAPRVEEPEDGDEVVFPDTAVDDPPRPPSKQRQAADPEPDGPLADHVAEPWPVQDTGQIGECGTCIFGRFPVDPNRLGKCYRLPPTAQMFFMGMEPVKDANGDIVKVPNIKVFSDRAWIKRTGPESGCGEWQPRSVQ